MLRLYKYCFYRITRFWDHPVHYSLSYDPLTQKVDPTHLISSMGIVSLLQISNLNTLLILPVLLLGHQLSANLLWIIVVAIAVFNVFILNKEKLYDDCEARWKDEPPKARKRNQDSVSPSLNGIALLGIIDHKKTTPHICAVKLHEYSFHYHKKQCCN